jgi:hypothetical protein
MAQIGTVRRRIEVPGVYGQCRDGMVLAQLLQVGIAGLGTLATFGAEEGNLPCLCAVTLGESSHGRR